MLAAAMRDFDCGRHGRQAPPLQPAEVDALACANALLSTFAKSPEFRSRIASIETVSRGIGRGTVSGADLARDYLMATIGGMGPSAFAVDSGWLSPGTTASTGPLDGTFVVTVSHETVGRLGRGATLAERGCGFNTIAHELVHTIHAVHSTTETFTDGGHGASAWPLASYTLGAVAHCTYLERYGSLPREELWSCVDAVGTKQSLPVAACSGSSGNFPRWTKRCAEGSPGCDVLPPECQLVPQKPPP